MLYPASPSFSRVLCSSSLSSKRRDLPGSPLDLCWKSGAPSLSNSPFTLVHATPDEDPQQDASPARSCNLGLPTGKPNTKQKRYRERGFTHCASQVGLICGNTSLQDAASRRSSAMLVLQTVTSSAVLAQIQSRYNYQLT